jgi:fission process protein 1
MSSPNTHTQTHNTSKVINFMTWRPFAYTSEVGEAFRPVIPRFLVNTAYGISIAYCFVDTGVKLNNMKHEPHIEIMKKACDMVVWHGFASMILPALTIHTVVKKSKAYINYLDRETFSTLSAKYNKTPPSNFVKVKPFIPTAIGLSIIPFIIHPIDKSVDYVMNFIRPFYWTPEQIETHKYKPH